MGGAKGPVGGAKGPVRGATGPVRGATGPMGRAKSNPPLGGSCSLFCRIVNSYNNQQHQQLDPV